MRKNKKIEHGFDSIKTVLEEASGNPFYNRGSAMV